MPNKSIQDENNKQGIFQIPEDIFKKNMPLHTQDIKNLSEACSGFSFFRKSSGKVDSYHLMDNVINFQIKEAIKIVKMNPQALFEQICYERTNKQVTEDSSPLRAYSPLQRAFMDLESCMWNSLYEIIKHDPKLLKQYKVQLQHVLEEIEVKYIGTIVRGDFTPGAFPVRAAGALVKDDKHLFKQVYQTRLSELKKHKELLLENSCNNHHSLN